MFVCGEVLENIQFQGTVKEPAALSGLTRCDEFGMSYPRPRFRSTAVGCFRAVWPQVQECTAVFSLRLSRRDRQFSNHSPSVGGGWVESGLDCDGDGRRVLPLLNHALVHGV